MLPVVLFHIGTPGFSGGFVGVDVFFVISGFLITGILLKEASGEGVSLIGFWERRVRRILPALFFMLLVITVAATVLYLPLQLRRYGQELLSQSVFASNILFFVKSGGYFHPVAETRTLLHTWSLAVEEQFYLVYPLVFVFALARGKKTLLAVIAALAAFSLLLSGVTTEKYQQANFYLLPFRAWELGLGCLLAFVPLERVPRKYAESITLAGVALILASVFLFDKKMSFPGFSALWPCLGAAFVILAGHKSHWSGSMLRSASLVRIGKISYPLYLWHWPLLVITTNVLVREPSLFEKALIVMASFILSWISWRFVEIPFRSKRVFRQRCKLFAAAFAGLLVFFVIGCVFHLTSGVPGRWSENVVKLEQGERDRNPRRGQCRNLDPAQIRNGELCALGEATKAEAGTTTFIWGDSHGDALLPVLETLADEYSVAGVQAAHVACKPIAEPSASHREGCIEFSKAVRDYVVAHGIRDLVLVFRWTEFKGGEKEYVEGIGNTLSALKNEGVRIWFVRQVPEYPYPVPQKLARAAASGQNPELLALDYRVYEERRLVEDRILEEIGPFVDHVLDPAEILCSKERGCLNTSGGYSLYTDYHHLTLRGAMYLKEYFGWNLFEELSK